MTGIIQLTCGLPMGIVGQAANRLFVANKLQQIFSFRNQKVKELFEKM